MKRSAGILALLTLALLLTASGCATAPIRVAPETTLVVALYPWVPRSHQFQAVITAAWAQVQPDVSLSFLSSKEWDGGYDTNPPLDADVYVFDAMFLDYFRSQGFLEPMSAGEIDDPDDFVAYAIHGVEAGGRYYAIPRLGCANILFYRKDDAQLAKATTLSEIKDALGQCTYTSEIPPDRRGLMVNMSGGTTDASLYLDTVHSLTGEDPPPLPWDPSEIDPSAMDNMRQILAMASYWNATRDTDQRASWFSQGRGRALIGYTESMASMSAETRDHIAFKVMPLSDDDTSAMFYADVIGVNTTTNQRGTRDLAVRLANVMASSATMVRSIGPDGDHPFPQYLMATRPSVFRALGRSFPIYNEMYGLITSSRPVMFRINEQSRDWLAAMKDTLRAEARRDYPCGCDYPASEAIADPAAAPAICKETCAAHGGWSGAWAQHGPAASAGKAACGCNACPLP